MKNEQVKYIVETILGDDAYENGYTALLNNFMIIINKEENLYSDINRWRYKFDYTSGLIERILVKPYSHDILKTPSHGHFDIYYDKDNNPTVYEYLCDKKDNHILTDTYMMGSIIMFIPQPEVIL